MKGYGYSGAKLILTGEHAVVYNIPAIAIPFNAFKTEVFITKSKGEITINSSYYTGNLFEGSNSVNSVIQIVKHVNNYLGCENKNIHIEINSNILPERGLGSSASVSVALTKALFNYYKKEFTNDLLIEIAMIGEKINHTNPSGIDVNVLVYNRPVWFVKGEKIEILNLNLNASIIVVDSNIYGETKKAIKIVNNNIIKNKQLVLNQFESINESSILAKKAITSNDKLLLGLAMNNNHEALNNIGVSTIELNEIRNNLINLGALGAKITGSGLGGCVIGLVNNKEEALLIKEKIKKHNSYIYNFGDSNES